MRALIVPVIATGLLLGAPGDEPNERQMRFAFEGSLSLQVRNALEFVAETSGEAALARIHESRTDRFTINSFQKLQCRKRPDLFGHVCEFLVDIGLADRSLTRTITGRFVSGSEGLAFVGEI